MRPKTQLLSLHDIQNSILTISDIPHALLIVSFWSCVILHKEHATLYKQQPMGYKSCIYKHSQFYEHGSCFI